MTSGWILCLAALSQTTWGNPSAGWQPGGTVTVAQQPTAATNQFSSQQTQAGSQFASPQQNVGQQNNVAVDRYGRPLPGQQTVLTQNNAAAQNTSTQSLGQHPRQTNTTTQQQAAQQPNNAWGGQTPSNTATWSANQQTNNWQQNGTTNQPNNQAAPQLIAPQNMPNQQNNWQTQPQYVQDPRTGQMVAAQQGTTGTVNTNWQTGQQPSNSQFGNQQFSGTSTQSNNQLGSNQFSGTGSNPQFDANFNTGGSRFGAQISLGDNRLRVADNSNFNQQHNPNTATQNVNGQFAGQTSNPSLGLQPPLQNTLPNGSNLQGNQQGSLNPHVLAQPPRADDGQQQSPNVTSDPRWANWQVGTTQATNVSQPNVTNPQSQNNVASQNTASADQTVNSQASNNQPSSHQSGQASQFGQNQVGTNQPGTNLSNDPSANGSQNNQAPTISPPNSPFGNPNNAGSNLFAAATNRNGGAQQAGYNQPTSPGVGSNNLFAMAAARNGGNANQASMNGTANGDQQDEEGFKMPFFFSLFSNLVMVGAVVYLGWIAFESHFRYRRALIEGDDYGREDDRDSRRR